jgi:hypothetical protein
VTSDALPNCFDLEAFRKLSGPRCVLMLHNSDGIPCPTFLALGLLTDDSAMPERDTHALPPSFLPTRCTPSRPCFWQNGACRYMLQGRFIPAAASSSAEPEPAPVSTDAAAVVEVPVSRGSLRPQDKVRLEFDPNWSAAMPRAPLAQYSYRIDAHVCRPVARCANVGLGDLPTDCGDLCVPLLAARWCHWSFRARE